MNEQFLTKNGVKSIVGNKSDRGVEKMMLRGLPHIKLPNGRVRFVRSEVEKWMMSFAVRK